MRRRMFLDAKRFAVALSNRVGILTRFAMKDDPILIAQARMALLAEHSAASRRPSSLDHMCFNELDL
jgi:hypothetical protein